MTDSGQDKNGVDKSSLGTSLLAGLQTQNADVWKFRRHEGKNSFRGWLWGITRKQVANHRRRQKAWLVGTGGSEAQKRLAQFPEASDKEPSVIGTADEQTLLLRRALGILQAEVEPRTWQVFWRVVVE